MLLSKTGTVCGRQGDEGKKEAEKEQESVEKDGEVRYNRGEELYTASDEFYRDVPAADRSAFARSLANKTSDMKGVKTKTLYIYAGNVYRFLADGYMHGKMLEVYVSDTFDKEKASRKEVYENGRIRTIADFRSESAWYGSERHDSDMLNVEDKQREDRHARISAEKRKSVATGDTGRNIQDYERDLKEADEIIRKLREKYGAVKIDVRMSRVTPAQDRTYNSIVEEIITATVKKGRNVRKDIENGNLGN